MIATILNELNQFSFLIAPIFYKLLFVSITGSLVGGIILCIRKCFDRKIPPIWKYLMWVVVIAALLVPFRPQSNIAVTAPISTVQDVSFRAAYDEISYQEFVYHQEPNADAALLHEIQTQEDTLFWKSLIFDVLLPLGWFFGACAIAIFFIAHKLYFLHQIEKHTIRTDQFEGLLTKCKQQLGIRGNVNVVLQDYIASPALISLIKPKILLPAYAQQMNNQSLYYVLLHELSHYKRKDMLVNYLLLTVQSIHWFNPAIWVLFKYIREDMELLNDSYVLSKLEGAAHRQYAKSLVEVLGRSHKVAFMPKLLCMADGSKNVKRRISMMKRGKTFQKHKVLVSVCCVAAICVVSGLFLTQGIDEADALLPQSDALTGTSSESVVAPSDTTTPEATPVQTATPSASSVPSGQFSSTQDGMVLFTSLEPDVSYTVTYPATWVIDQNNLPNLTIRPDANESSSYFNLQAALYIPNSDDQSYNTYERKNAEDEANWCHEQTSEQAKVTVIEVSELTQTTVACYDAWYYTESDGPRTIEYYFIDAQTVNGHYKLQLGYAPETDDSEREAIRQIAENLVLLT
ncbi:MAG: M56 family metallopeptidase [Faecalibacterium sp.]